MFELNSKQSKRLDELIQIMMIADLTGQRWFLVGIYFTPSQSIEDQFEIVKIVFVDKKVNFLTISMDINGNIMR